MPGALKCPTSDGRSRAVLVAIPYRAPDGVGQATPMARGIGSWRGCRQEHALLSERCRAVRLARCAAAGSGRDSSPAHDQHNGLDPNERWRIDGHTHSKVANATVRSRSWPARLEPEFRAISD